MEVLYTSTNPRKGKLKLSVLTAITARSPTVALALTKETPLLATEKPEDKGGFVFTLRVTAWQSEPLQLQLQPNQGRKKEVPQSNASATAAFLASSSCLELPDWLLSLTAFGRPRRKKAMKTPMAAIDAANR